MTDVANKKILIIRNAYAHDFGGGERFPVELANELKNHGYNPIIISRSPKLLDFAKSRQITTIKGWWWSHQDFSGIKTALFPLYLIWQLLLTAWYSGLIIKFRPEVVHPQSRDDFIAATLAGKLSAKRVIWTDHADLKYVWQNHRVWYKNPVGKLVYFVSRFADTITLVSRSEQKLIEEQLGNPLPEKFRVIHNGVRTPNIRPMKRNPEDKDAVVFVATSRLVTAKGIGELIEAFKQIDDKSNVRLWLLGEGPEAEKYQKQAAGHEHISFLGFPENALSYVAAADIFVHPSYHEGFSISLVEAAALGKPIIACNVGGNPEIVKDRQNGLLIPPKDVTALSKAMAELMADQRLRQQYGLVAKRTYQENFVFEQIVAERFVPLYEK